MPGAWASRGRRQGCCQGRLAPFLQVEGLGFFLDEAGSRKSFRWVVLIHDEEFRGLLVGFRAGARSEERTCGKRVRGEDLVRGGELCWD